MSTIDRSKPVMVTGATGYVAGWLIKKLLDEGFTVHATVRDPKKLDKIQPLQALADNTQGSIKFFKADLLTQGAYDEAMQGCELVFHTASPFKINVVDNQKDLIDPALKGTRNVLDSVNRMALVKRVVLTSSVAAMMTDAKDVAELPNATLTEATWNTTASLDYQPYAYSKTLAEKAAWQMAEAQNRWDLVSINPSLVIGGAIGASSTSESFSIFTQMGDGTMKAGAPAFTIGCVDVRDVADAHFAAAFTPEATGRHITSGHVSNMTEMAGILHKTFGARYPIPTKKIPKFLLWLIGPIATKGLVTRKSVSRNVEISCYYDNSKSINALGVSYRPIEDSLNHMFEYMIDNNYFD